MDPVRYGLIGSGWIADVHLRALREVRGAAVAAVADVPRDRPLGREGRGAELARRHDVPAYYADYRSMLDRRDVDVVLIALPNHLHAQVAMDALSAKKHLVLE